MNRGVRDAVKSAAASAADARNSTACTCCGDEGRARGRTCCQACADAGCKLSTGCRREAVPA